MSSARSMSEEAARKHEKMMKCGRGAKVYLKGGYEEVTTPGEIRIQDWSQRERTVRALKFGGACWGAALVSIIIPLLHFILVPGFLLAGPILAFIIIGQENVVLGGEGTCPKMSGVSSHCSDRISISNFGSLFALPEWFED